MELTEITGLEHPQVRDERGVKVGDVAAVYADDDSDSPVFVEVALVGEDRHAVVPLVGAAITARGLVLSFAADDVVRGPSATVTASMSEALLAEVLRYYGLEASVESGRDLTAKKQRRLPRRIPFKKRNLPPIADTRPDQERW